MTHVIMSDTHNEHNKLIVPAGDTVIHCGDFTLHGTIKEISSFLNWFGNLPHKNKILIAGNHDWLFEQNQQLARSLIPDNVHYLENSGVTIDGITYYGVPNTPQFSNWAFMGTKEQQKHIFQKVPDNVDILICHGPPKGILDDVNGKKAGCEALLETVNRIKPFMVCFGHIHEGYGEKRVAGTHFINASVLNEDYALENSVQIFECL